MPGTSQGYWPGARPVCHHCGVPQPETPLPPTAFPANTAGEPTAARPALRRPAAGILVAGVCAGLAEHLDLPVRKVRLLTVLLGLSGGLGLIGYIFFWVTIPVADPDGEQRSPLVDRLIKPQVPGGPVARPWYARFPIKDIALGALLVGLAILLVVSRFGFALEWTWVFSALVVVIGIALAWSQLDAAQRGELVNKSGGRVTTGSLRLVGGVVLVTIGALLLAGQESAGSNMLPALIAALSVLVGVGLVLAPWWLRLVNQLGLERAAKEREATRADIAAHLHDSVLQTLALIQHNAQSPGEVTRLARNQERELRQWLYNERKPDGTSLAAQARELVAQVENTMAVALDGQSSVLIDLVVVGDCPPTADTEALLAACGEALKNAVRHGKPPVSMYLEVSPEEIEAFVTDRGAGFDMDNIAKDRFGVRQSIVGRMKRRGGTAHIKQLNSGGTEVALKIGRTAQPAGHTHGAGDQPVTSEKDHA